MGIWMEHRPGFHWRGTHRCRLVAVALGPLVIVVLWVCYNLGLFPFWQRGSADAAFRLFDYPVWPDFRLPPHSDRWYDEVCFSNRRRDDLSELGQNLQFWRSADNAHCKWLYHKFQTIFSVHYRSANISMPSAYQEKVLGWMGGSRQLYDQVEHQRILQVINRLDLQNMAYNPGRALRPQPRDPNRDPRQEFLEQTERSRATCDFCQYKTMTASEPDMLLGVNESQHAVVVSNTFKLDGSHAMVVSRVHSTLELTESMAVDMTHLMVEWSRQVHRLHPRFHYPSAVQDVGYHAGMSQLHPHLQVFVSPNHYPGGIERLRHTALQYHRQQRGSGANYFSDLVELHAALGLTVRLGRAVAFASVNPMLDMEVWVLQAEPGPDWYRLVHYVMLTYQDRLGVYCYSSGWALPAEGDRRGRLPALVRLLTRGDCTAVRADVSSFELFLISSISVNPYRVIQELRATVAQHTSGEGAHHSV